MSLMFAPQAVTRRGNDLIIRLGSHRFSEVAQTIRYLRLIKCTDIEAALAEATAMRLQGDHVAAIDIRLTELNRWEVAFHMDDFGLTYRFRVEDLETANYYADSDI